VRARLVHAGFDVDFLDLYAEDFDPRMRPEDEPDWADPDKPGSSEVEGHKAHRGRRRREVHRSCRSMTTSSPVSTYEISIIY